MNNQRFSDNISKLSSRKMERKHIQQEFSYRGVSNHEDS